MHPPWNKHEELVVAEQTFRQLTLVHFSSLWYTSSIVGPHLLKQRGRPCGLCCTTSWVWPSRPSWCRWSGTRRRPWSRPTPCAGFTRWGGLRRPTLRRRRFYSCLLCASVFQINIKQSQIKANILFREDNVLWYKGLQNCVPLLVNMRDRTTKTLCTL